MATEITEFGGREVSYKGEFDLSELLDLIVRWFKSKSFVKDDKDIDEKYYIHEDLPDGSKNISFSWSVINESGVFVKKIDIDFVIVGIKKVDLIFDNKKLNLDSGEIGIKLKAKIEFDPDNKFKSNFFMSEFYKLFWKPLNGSYVSSVTKNFQSDFEKLYSNILGFFEIEGRVSDPKIYVKGYKEQ